MYQNDQNSVFMKNLGKFFFLKQCTRIWFLIMLLASENFFLKCHVGRFSTPCDSKSKILTKISPRDFGSYPFFV